MTKRKYDYEKYLTVSDKYTKFLKTYENRPSTYRSYRAHLAKYFQDMKIENPDNYLKDTRALNGKDKIAYLDGLEEDFTAYWQKINKEMQGKTPYVWLSAIKMFCTFNKTFELDDVFMKLQRNGHGNYSVTKTRTPTKKQLLKIFSYSNPESKALFMFQLTSGQRIEQVVGTTFDDIDMGFDCPRIYYSKAKQKHWVKTRISPESKKCLEEYLQQRERFIKIRKKRGEFKRKNNLDLNKIFPMDEGTANTIWTTMVKNAGLYKLDKNTRKPELGTHSLRRYFLNHFSDREFGDFFSGHITPRNKEYRQYSDERLDEEYNKSIGDLTIFESTPDLSGVHQQLKVKDEQIDELELKVSRLQNKINGIQNLDEETSKKLFETLLSQAVKDGKVILKK